MPAFNNKHAGLTVKVNLLPKDAFSESGIGKMLDWALTTGRYIVIFTEMVVILTFLQRFNLDRQLSNLNESIFERQAVLESYSQIESEIRHIQAKAEFIEELDGQVDILVVLDFLSDNAPVDVIFDNLSVTNQVFSVEGIAYSQDSLSSFVDTINNYEGVSDVSLDKITQNKDSSGTDFSLRIDFTNSTQ